MSHRVGTKTILGMALVLAWIGAANAAVGRPAIVPKLKTWTAHTGALTLSTAKVEFAKGDLSAEGAWLSAALEALEIHQSDAGVPIRLVLAAPEIPLRSSRYAEQLRAQAYRLVIAPASVHIEGATPAGVFYACQTLLQLLQDGSSLPCGEILDWPDLAYRGIMVDPARANENAAYYERLIRFAARYKLNRIHVHLTDDQAVCLYHEEYPSLMHPHAWRPHALHRLVTLARQHHIELIPEIESLGHARIFLKHPAFREILHQTVKDKPAGSWSGTTEPGYTNVLCPASDKTFAYLDAMYTRCAEVFPFPELHIGCDEVDLTVCARCEKAFPGVSHEEWFRQHVLRCRELVAKHGKRTALWGDMLLAHPEVVDGLPVDDVVVYDWHYRPEVLRDSVAFFKERGFEVVACPALMCWPHMVVPAAGSYQNIRRFAALARQEDIRGVDTTIWIPPRYMSEVLWPGIAFAAQQAWIGGAGEADAFYDAFARDHFGMPDSAGLTKAWQTLAAVDWDLSAFKTACWVDGDSLAKARAEAVEALGLRARGHLASLADIRRLLAELRPTVRKNHLSWQAAERSAAILEYVLRHLLEAPIIDTANAEGRDRLRKLDERCVELMRWIESDWDRNRYADDPEKGDASRTGQNLLHRFRRMHEYHRALLAGSVSTE